MTRFDARLVALLGIAEASETVPTWSDFIHAHDQERVLKELTAAGAGHGVFDTEFRVRDGSLRWLAGSGPPGWRQESKRMVGLRCDVRNVSKRKSPCVGVRND
ncbi:MAG: PAS domain-containing protein [Nitrospira sp.]